MFKQTVGLASSAFSREMNTSQVIGRRNQALDSVRDVGNTLRNARNIGQFKPGGSFNYSGDLPEGDVDVYRFRIPQGNTGTVSLRFTGNASSSFLNRRGRILSQSSQSGTGNSLSQSFVTLQPGIYFIKLEGLDEGSGDYQFRFRYVP
jgi:hypothetical protein